MRRAGGTGFKGCGRRKWDRVGDGVQGSVERVLEASWFKQPIPALSETGVSVSQEQLGVRLGLDHAELLGVSHIRGYAAQKAAEKKGENAGRIKRRNILARGRDQQCRGVRLHTSHIPISLQSQSIKEDKGYYALWKKTSREKIVLLKKLVSCLCRQHFKESYVTPNM